MIQRRPQRGAQRNLAVVPLRHGRNNAGDFRHAVLHNKDRRATCAVIHITGQNQHIALPADHLARLLQARCFRAILRIRDNRHVFTRLKTRITGKRWHDTFPDRTFQFDKRDIGGDPIQTVPRRIVIVRMHDDPPGASVRRRPSLAPASQKMDAVRGDPLAGFFVIHAMRRRQDQVFRHQRPGAEPRPLQVQTSDSLPRLCLIGAQQPTQNAIFGTG